MNTGDAFADFLLGIPTQGQVEGLPVVEYRGTYFSPFIQDTWRVTSNLTLNYGLSWYLLGKNIFPSKITAPLSPSYPASLPAGTLASALDPALRTGYVSQWNFSLQKGLSKSDSVELSYLGSSGHRLLYYTDLSQCRPSADLFCNPAAKPWPRYDLLIWFDSGGNSSYHGLIGKYEHRMDSGLNLRFEYTFAKALTDAWQSSQTPGNQIASCRACDKGPATFDVRHRAVTSAF